MLADNPALGTPPADGRRHAAHLQLRRQPADPRDRRLRLQPQADRRPAVPRHLQRGRRPARSTPTRARDSDGHGTHTTTTAAGDVVDHAPIFGVDRGPISGVAPGAWVIEYKVCGLEGCFGSDSAAAVAAGDPRRRRRHQLLDQRWLEPVHRPGRAGLPRRVQRRRPSRRRRATPAGGGHHRAPSPWVITVAASTQTRDFESTLTLSSCADTRRWSAPRSPSRGRAEALLAARPEQYAARRCPGLRWLHCLELRLRRTGTGGAK